MNRWFLFNFILLTIAIWHLTEKYFWSTTQPHLLFGFLGLLFILFNWTRHAMYSTIREAKSRDRKIKYAQLSKKVVHIHKWTGTTALVLIVFHLILTLNVYSIQLTSLKIMSGILALTLLVIVVIFGWLRFFQPTLRKRYIHLYVGMAMVFTVLIHLLL